MTRALECVLAKKAVGLAKPEDLRTAAGVALEDGLDSPALRILAGLSETELSEAEALLYRAVNELGLHAPTPRKAVLQLARKLAARIAEGTLPPYEGARRIWELTLRVPEEDFPELDSFVYAASEWQERPEDRPSFDAGIVSAARDLVST